MELPIKYSTATYAERKRAREKYVLIQKGKCYHCKSSLNEEPPQEILEKDIHWDLFPDDFLDFPIHLHHSHKTDLTIGAVHNYCNAVLWQYYGE